MIDDVTKDLLASRLRTLAADYRLELMPLKFRQSMIDSADEIERLRMEIDDHFRTRDTERLLSENGDFPEPENVAEEDNTPATHATPSQGSVQSECTLTDAEREAVEWRRKGIIVYSAGTVVATIATAVLSLSLLWFAK